MAEAYGKLTGRPGICFVTRGPGATNASIGVHTAFQDSTPLILFIGQVDSEFTEREAFQEIDYRRMYGQMAKWVAQIDRADRVPEMVSHAFHLAVSGRPGPVVLALPEDMQTARATVADTRALPARRRASRRRRHAEAARHACASGAPVRDRWAAAAGTSSLRRRRGICAGECTAGRRAPIAARISSTTAIRTTSATLAVGMNPAARAAHSQCRPAARDRAAPGRMDHDQLHADRHPAPEAEIRSRACRRRGTGPRLSGRPADQLRHAANLPSAARALTPVRRAWVESTQAARARIRSVAEAASRCRARST